MKYEKEFRNFIETCLHDVDTSTTQKDRHHAFDMAFGGAWFLMNHIDPDHFGEYNSIWNEKHEIFRQKGCMQND